MKTPHEEAVYAQLDTVYRKACWRIIIENRST